MAAVPKKKWQQIVDNYTTGLPGYERMRIEGIVLKEKMKYNAALVRVNKGMEIVSKELSKVQNDKLSKQYQALTMSKARFYYELSHIHFLLRKYDKAIAYGKQALDTSKTVSSNSSYEVLKWKEIIALSYRNVELWKECLVTYNEILYSLDSIILGLSNNNNNNNNNANNSIDNSKLNEMQRWKGKITYEIGMVYNNLKKFEEAEVMARKSLELNETFCKAEEMEVLSKMLLAVIISAPQCSKYEESLDILKQARTFVTSKIETLKSQTESKDSTDSTDSKQEEKKNNITKTQTTGNDIKNKQQIAIWSNHLTQINSLMNKIIPFFIKSLKQKKNAKTKANSRKDNNTENKSNNQPNQAMNKNNNKHKNKNKNKNKNKGKNRNKNKGNSKQNSNPKITNQSQTPNDSNSAIDETLEMVD